MVNTCMVLTDGTLMVGQNGDDNLYGDTVKLRRSQGVNGDPMTIMIDTKHALPAGVLQYFYMFIEQQNPSASASHLWLQIWRQYALHVDDQYQLVWRRLVYLNDSYPHALYTVKPLML